jgi:hypothetical protein
MSHESVWNSRPRTYGKGSRSWYVGIPSSSWRLYRDAKIDIRGRILANFLWFEAEFAHTGLVLSASMDWTSADNASEKRPQILDLSRYAICANFVLPTLSPQNMNYLTDLHSTVKSSDILHCASPNFLLRTWGRKCDNNRSRNACYARHWSYGTGSHVLDIRNQSTWEDIALELLKGW